MNGIEVSAHLAHSLLAAFVLPADLTAPQLRSDASGQANRILHWKSNVVVSACSSDTFLPRRLALARYDFRPTTNNCLSIPLPSSP